jgi:nucleoside-diphosphate-sugar epimerase
MRVAVTGSTSGIGKQLIRRILDVGHAAIPLGRTHPNFWKLGEGLPRNLEIDAVIHLAHDRSLSVDQNVEAALALCSSFEGPKVFLSSFSAHSKSLSVYGKSKYEVESVFERFNGCSLRAGVVYGNNVGGFFAQFERLVTNSFVVPIPYRGLPLLFTTHVEDLINEIIVNLELSGGSKVFAGHSVPISLQELVFQINESADRKRPAISLWREPMNASLRLLAKISPGIPMVDSLLSLSRQASYEEISRLRLPRSKFRSFSLLEKI